ASGLTTAPATKARMIVVMVAPLGRLPPADFVPLRALDVVVVGVRKMPSPMESGAGVDSGHHAPPIRSDRPVVFAGRVDLVEVDRVAPDVRVAVRLSVGHDRARRRPALRVKRG